MLVSLCMYMPEFMSRFINTDTVYTAVRGQEEEDGTQTVTSGCLIPSSSWRSLSGYHKDTHEGGFFFKCHHVIWFLGVILILSLILWHSLLKDLKPPHNVLSLQC